MLLKPAISLIAAMDKKHAIGIGNHLPWHLPADLKRFKTLTMGKPIIMGRKTHESIGRPLPGRCNIVLTRNANFQAEGCEQYPSLDEAIIAYAGVPEIMIIGGDSVYRQALPRAQRLYLTLIEAAFDGDAWFPEYLVEEWQLIDEVCRAADETFNYAYRFVTLQRKEWACKS